MVARLGYRSRGYARRGGRYRPVTIGPTSGARLAVPLPAAGPVPFDAGPITLVTLPRPVHIVAYQADDFMFTLTVFDAEGDPADLDTTVVAAEIAAVPRPGPIVGQFAVGVDQNEITLHLEHATSEILPLRCVWDCQLTSDTNWVTTIVAGNLTLTADVTR
jgi:hypothetical protein